MKKEVERRIQQIQEEGLYLDFGLVLNDAIETYKKTFLWSALAIFLTTVFIWAIVIVGMIAVFGVSRMATEDMSGMTLLSMDPMVMGLYIGASIIVGALIAPMTAGFLELPKAADQNEDFSFVTVFKYYASKKFLPIFTLVLITGFITSCVGMGNQILNYSAVTWVNITFNILFSIFTLMALPLVIFADAKPLEALTHSVGIVKKNFWIILGLMIVAFVAAFCGILLCCIGLIFTIPFVYSMVVAIYKHSIGFYNEETDVMDEMNSTEETTNT